MGGADPGARRASIFSGPTPPAPPSCRLKSTRQRAAAPPAVAAEVPGRTRPLGRRWYIHPIHDLFLSGHMGPGRSGRSEPDPGVRMPGGRGGGRGGVMGLKRSMRVHLGRGRGGCRTPRGKGRGFLLTRRRMPGPGRRGRRSGRSDRKPGGGLKSGHGRGGPGPGPEDRVGEPPGPCGRSGPRVSGCGMLTYAASHRRPPPPPSPFLGRERDAETWTSTSPRRVRRGTDWRRGRDEPKGPHTGRTGESGTPRRETEGEESESDSLGSRRVGLGERHVYPFGSGGRFTPLRGRRRLVLGLILRPRV